MTKLERATTLLRNILAAGARRADAVADSARQAGLSPRTVTRARAALDVQASRNAGVWWLSLPAPAASTSTTSSTSSPLVVQPFATAHPKSTIEPDSATPDAPATISLSLTNPAIAPLVIDPRDPQDLGVADSGPTVPLQAGEAGVTATTSAPGSSGPALVGRAEPRPDPDLKPAASPLRAHQETWLGRNLSLDPTADSTKAAWGCAWRAEQATDGAITADTRMADAEVDLDPEAAPTSPRPAAAGWSAGLSPEATANIAAWKSWRDAKLAGDPQANVSLSTFVAHRSGQAAALLEPAQAPTVALPPPSMEPITATSSTALPDAERRTLIAELEEFLQNRTQGPQPAAGAVRGAAEGLAPSALTAPAERQLASQTGVGPDPTPSNDHDSNLAALSAYSAAEILAAVAAVESERLVATRGAGSPCASGGAGSIPQPPSPHWVAVQDDEFIDWSQRESS